MMDDFRQRVVELSVRTERFKDGSWRVHCAICGSSWVGQAGEPPANHPLTVVVGDGPDDVVDSFCPLAVAEDQPRPSIMEIVSGDRDDARQAMQVVVLSIVNINRGASRGLDTAEDVELVERGIQRLDAALRRIDGHVKSATKRAEAMERRARYAETTRAEVDRALGEKIEEANLLLVRAETAEATVEKLDILWKKCAQAETQERDRANINREKVERLQKALRHAVDTIRDAQAQLGGKVPADAAGLRRVLDGNVEATAALHDERNR